MFRTDPDPVPVPAPDGATPGPGAGSPRLPRASLLALLLLSSAARAQSPAPPTLQLPLAGPAAAHVSTLEPPDAGDADLVQSLAAARPSLAWSACLARAAGAFAATTAGRRAESLPPDLLEAVLLRAGCPDPYAEVGTAVSRSDRPAEVVALAAELDRAAARPFTHAGLARAPEPGGKTRWAAVLTRRLVEVEPFPVRLRAGSTVTLRFRLTAGLERPEVAAIGPDGCVSRASSRCDATGCATEIAAGDQPGPLWVQLVAEGEGGQVFAAQVRAGVEVDPPDAWEGTPVVDPEPFVTPAEGEAQLARLVNAERLRHGLAPCVVDPQLAAAARAHSADMRDAGFFDHRSPTRGGLMTRLQSSGYAVRSARENIARATGVAAAHAALMASPGHRANLLWPELTRLGVGAVNADGGDSPGPLVITQILALPRGQASARVLRQVLLGRMAEARGRAGRPPLARDPRLDRWAERLARHAAATGALDPEALASLDADLGPPGEGPRTVRAELLTASDPALLEIPEALARIDRGALGIGLEVGDPGSRGLPITVVLVVVETLPLTVTPAAD